MNGPVPARMMMALGGTLRRRLAPIEGSVIVLTVGHRCIAGPASGAACLLLYLCLIETACVWHLLGMMAVTLVVANNQR